jgi:hypothetical protein
MLTGTVIEDLMQIAEDALKRHDDTVLDYAYLSDAMSEWRKRNTWAVSLRFEQLPHSDQSEIVFSAIRLANRGKL